MMAAESPSASSIILMIFLYTLTYFPTIALANTLAMHTMTDAAREFPRVRVFGTLGWIAAGLTLAYTGWGNTIGMFHLAAGAAALLGVYSFTLPHVPPPAKGQASRSANPRPRRPGAIQKPQLRGLYCSSFLICMPLAFATNWPAYCDPDGDRQSAV
jgi:hypothetical protein